MASSPHLAPPTASALAGLILAGGQGRRMGHADKGLLPWRGRPLVEHVREALAPQVSELWISANRNAERYGAYGTVVPDDPALGSYQGPLAGLASVLPCVSASWVLTWGCDMPNVPADFAARMAQAAARHRAALAVAVAGGRMQPVCMLASAALLPGLLAYLESGGRRVDGWQQAAGAVLVRFDDQPDAFFNVNTPDDLQP